MKKKRLNFSRFISAFLVLVFTISILPEFSVKAEDAVIDLVGDSSIASTSTFKNGISASRTGYLCYLLTSDGKAVPGTSAKLYKCPGYAGLGGGIIRCTSRKGGYSASSWNGVAPWNCSPFNADQTTNAEVIRAWIKAECKPGVSNGNQFVADVWGDACSTKFKDGEYILVMETVLNFQYTLKFRYDKSLKLDAWKRYYWTKLREGNPSVPLKAADGPARYYYDQAQKGTEYKALFGVPFVGTVRDCLGYFSEAKADAESTHPFIKVANVNYYTKYLNKIACFAERIGVGSAGQRAGFLPYTGSVDVFLSDAEVNTYGVGMLVISSLDDDLASTDVPLPPDTPDPSGYDGTVYTLSATGGSTSDSDRVGATTYFGTGGYGCLSGSFYAENCASGTDAYNLAESMSSGMSYEGDVPQVVFSGTSYDLSVESSLGIVAGMLTVDPSTFPYVDIHSSSTEKDYESYLSSIKSGLYPTIDRVYNNGSKGTSTYDSSTMDCGDILGGDSHYKIYSANLYFTLTSENTNPDASIAWEVDNTGRVGDRRGVINMTVSPSLQLDFGKVLYNRESLTDTQWVHSMTTIRQTSLWSAYKKSVIEYISHLQKDGTLQKIWTEELNKAITAKENEEANKAYLAYKKSNPEPVAPTAVYKPYGMSDEEWLASERYLTYKKAYEAWQKAHDEWQSAVNAVKKAAKEKANREYMETKYDKFTYFFGSGRGYSGSTVKVSQQDWKFKFYWCTPIMQKTYAVDDKIPINDGPSRSSRSPLFSKAWKVSFNYTLENTNADSLGSAVLDRMLTYLPLVNSGADNIEVPSVGVSAGDVQYYIYNKKIDKTDFLLPDATSMDMR